MIARSVGACTGPEPFRRAHLEDPKSTRFGLGRDCLEDPKWLEPETWPRY